MVKSLIEKQIDAYHSTNTTFKKFDTSFIGLGAGTSFGNGFYFSNEPIDEYGKAIKVTLNIDNPYEFDFNNDDEVIKFLKDCGCFENIYFYKGIHESDRKWSISKTLDENGEKDLDKLKSKGYDALIIHNTPIGIKDKKVIDTEYLVWDSDKIEIKESLKESILLEKTRQDLINKSKSGSEYSKKNQSRGKNRWERRTYSQVANSVRDYNQINMDAFFKEDILEFGINVHGETDNYVVTVLFEGILGEIRREVQGNNNKLEFKCVLRALLKIFNSNDVYVSCTCKDWCLKEDTKIKLLDGTTPTVKEMKERFDNGEKLYVFSVDEKGDFKPGKVNEVWISNYSNDMIRITLDNGKVIETTPNHRYMLRDGSYLEAKDLEVGTSLMPLYFKINQLNCKVKKIEYIHYEEPIPVYDIEVDKYNNFYVDSGVVLHNCYRFKYWAQKNGYNSAIPDQYTNMRPKPQGQGGAAGANDQDTKGSACKHVNLVISNLDWMMKVASVINNYIKWCRVNMERNYADYIFPQVYGVPYNKAIQLSLFDDPNDNGLLPSDQDTINQVINKSLQGRGEKGQWAKGNPYRFQRKETETNPVDNPNQLHLTFGDEKEKELIPDEEE